jgi:hypothetical protein
MGDGSRQAQVIAYLDDYKLLLIATLAVIPLLSVSHKQLFLSLTTHTVKRP